MVCLGRVGLCVRVGRAGRFGRFSRPRDSCGAMPLGGDGPHIVRGVSRRQGGGIVERACRAEVSRAEPCMELKGFGIGCTGKPWGV